MEFFQQERTASSLREQIIVFRLNDEAFGLNIALVNEIIEVGSMNVVPRSPEFITGVINYHGRIFPVLDLAAFFGLSSTENGTQQARIIVLVPGNYHMAFRVDGVKEIVSVPEEEEVRNPMEGKDFKNIYIKKVVCIEETPVNIIDVEILLTDLEDYFKEANIEH